MRVAINTDDWAISTKDSVNTESGLKQLKEAVEIGNRFALQLEEYLEKVEGEDES